MTQQLSAMLRHFEYKEHPVRVVLKDGEPWFVLTDVCRVLAIGNSSDVMARLDTDEKTLEKIEGFRGPKTALVNEPGLYTVIIRSNKPEAKGFTRWITHDVIPSIRKTGGYGQTNLATADMGALVRDPKLVAEALAYIQELTGNVRELEARVDEQNAVITKSEKRIKKLEPKAHYCDVILESKDTVPVSVIAKDYGMTAVRFNQLLRELKVQYKVGRTWLLHQQYANKGYTSTRTVPEKREGGVRGSSVHTEWTQTGRLALYELLKEQGILPCIERTLPMDELIAAAAAKTAAAE